jgi:amino acid-DNA transferase-like protein
VSRRDDRALADLVEFARVEQLSGDIEPWAVTLRAHYLNDLAQRGPAASETSLWTVHLYNSTDDLSSTFTLLDAAPSPAHWVRADGPTQALASRVFLGGERRNLRGGKLGHRLDSYTGLLAGDTQHSWIDEALAGGDPMRNFEVVMPYLQRVWGVGRLAAFEWAEFLGKVGGYPIETTDGALWESSGPRQSLERIYRDGRAAPSDEWLSDVALLTKAHLAEQGVTLSWWDFETVICDFNVMRKGRYYPGKHLAMITEEIAALPERWREPLTVAYRSVIPEGWRDLPPGADKELGRRYAETGQMPMLLETR